jgi:hypothetical protein
MTKEVNVEAFVAGRLTSGSKTERWVGKAEAGAKQ